MPSSRAQKRRLSMTKEQYIRMTGWGRSAVARLPGGAKALRAPTLVCAAAYLYALLFLMLSSDMRIFRALLVPAVCFGVVTVLRPAIGRTRPYDRFGASPVGPYRSGKGKSMPSRHAASAAAIACAVVYVFPSPWVTAAMLALCALIAALRVLSGQHYISDVAVALAISFSLSALGYLL